MGLLTWEKHEKNIVEKNHNQVFKNCFNQQNVSRAKSRKKQSQNRGLMFAEHQHCVLSKERSLTTYFRRKGQQNWQLRDDSVEKRGKTSQSNKAISRESDVIKNKALVLL